jgi:tetraacyldisaccharide 4'-kinase
VLAERALGVTVHVLDDGFQHRRLARDVDIVVVTPEDLSDRQVPFGRLREPVTALQAADAIVVDSEDTATKPPASRPVFALRRSLRALEPLEPECAWPRGDGPVLAVAGIARPERFARSLERAGVTVARTVAFPDHHRFRRRDVERIAEIARTLRVSAVVTTEKDAVRLLRLRPLPCLFASAPLEVSPEPAAEFQSWILAKLREARA